MRIIFSLQSSRPLHVLRSVLFGMEVLLSLKEDGEIMSGELARLLTPRYDNIIFIIV
jgi:hypothetical protein